MLQLLKPDYYPLSYLSKYIISTNNILFIITKKNVYTTLYNITLTHSSTSSSNNNNVLNTINNIEPLHLPKYNNDNEIIYSSCFNISEISYLYNNIILPNALLVISVLNNNQQILLIYGITYENDKPITAALIQIINMNIFVTSIKFLVNPPSANINNHPSLNLIVTGDLSILVYSLSISEDKKLNFILSEDSMSFSEFKINSKIYSFDVMYLPLNSNWVRFAAISLLNGVVAISVKSQNECTMNFRVFDSLCRISLYSYGICDGVLPKNAPVSALHDRALKAMSLKPSVRLLIASAIGAAYSVNLTNSNIMDAFKDMVFLKESDQHDTVITAGYNNIIAIGCFSNDLLIYDKNCNLLAVKTLGYPIVNTLFVDINGDGLLELLILTTHGLYIFYPDMTYIYDRLTNVLELLEEIKLLESQKL